MDNMINKIITEILKADEERLRDLPNSQQNILTISRRLADLREMGFTYKAISQMLTDASEKEEI